MLLPVLVNEHKFKDQILSVASGPALFMRKFIKWIEVSLYWEDLRQNHF
jgi:hypothetical protein